MEVFWQQGGAPAACAVARERRGTWFDPALVDAVAGFEHDRAFWASLHEPDVNALEPADRVQRADDARLDRVAEAFATIVDAKSPFTASHSAGVAEIAEAIAATMGVDATTCRLLRRAGLLHDVGKLGVSNRILDKPGKLDDEEWAAMRRHPELSRVILASVPALADVARLAGTHHERLDGSGYPDCLTAAELDLPDRILQVADVAEALGAERPYRAALPFDEVLSIMGRDAGPKLDAGAFAALEAWLPGRGASLADAA
jgi:putative nucleotidyltransferase with HDIG domain